ncbi:MAG: cupin domain-containing protein [Flavobacteriales bacterium]|nr:cupin domain-containing protein [Flavobacteriales bacterium]
MTKTFEPSYPHIIENKFGEKLIFRKLVKDHTGEWLDVENFVQPGSGPIMHVHHKQHEGLTVVVGKLGYQTLGGPEKFVGTGETVEFKPGEAHRFWNAGDTVLNCTGHINPADNIVYFLTQIYKSMDENGGRPGPFDSAFLMKKYKSEFDIVGLPGFVRNVILPLTLFFGKLSGKHKKFADAPEAVK